MKKKIVIPIIISVFLGCISAKLVYNGHKLKAESTSVNYNSYLLQVGVYNDKETLDKALANLNDYIVKEEDNKYYVYIGITTSKENANKIKNAYKDQDINIYIKEGNIDNVEFMSNLEQFDILLDGVSREKDILSINEVILSSYEEMVMGQ